MIHVADQRIHGTTKRQVGTHFLEVEKSVLQPLAPTLFSCFEEARRSVHRDSYIAVKGAYYEVPAQYIGQRVWVRWDAKMIRIFDQQMKQVATHARLEPGKFTQVLAVGGSRGSVEQSVGYYRQRVVELGQPILTWADVMIAQDNAGALRRLQGLLGLRKKTLQSSNQPSRPQGQYPRPPYPAATAPMAEQSA